MYRFTIMARARRLKRSRPVLHWAFQFTVSTGQDANETTQVPVDWAGDLQAAITVCRAHADGKATEDQALPRTTIISFRLGHDGRGVSLSKCERTNQIRQEAVKLAARK